MLSVVVTEVFLPFSKLLRLIHSNKENKDKNKNNYKNKNKKKNKNRKNKHKHKHKDKDKDKNKNKIGFMAWALGLGGFMAWKHL